MEIIDESVLELALESAAYSSGSADPNAYSQIIGVWVWAFRVMGHSLCKWICCHSLYWAFTRFVKGEIMLDLTSHI